MNTMMKTKRSKPSRKTLTVTQLCAGVDLIQGVLNDHPDWTNNQVHDALAKAGMPVSLSLIRRHRKRLDRKKKIAVPDGCGPLVDAIFRRLPHRPGDTIMDIKNDMQEAVAFLEDIPDDTPLADFDLTSNYSWGKEALARIKKG